MTLLIVALIALQIADGVTTYIGLRHRGVSEGNGIVARVLQRLGVVPGLVVVKGAAAAITIWGALLAPWAGYLVAAGYVVVIFLNIRTIS